jgi:hypothetical protein
MSGPLVDYQEEFLMQYGTLTPHARRTATERRNNKGTHHARASALTDEKLIEMQRRVANKEPLCNANDRKVVEADVDLT